MYISNTYLKYTLDFYIMEPAEPKPLKTRERLLLTASMIFAEKGYHEATIAEICQQAETNIAAVNYHFQDKENLYLQAWRHAFQDSGHRPDRRFPALRDQARAESRIDLSSLSTSPDPTSVVDRV